MAAATSMRDDARVGVQAGRKRGPERSRPGDVGGIRERSADFVATLDARLRASREKSAIGRCAGRRHLRNLGISGSHRRNLRERLRHVDGEPHVALDERDVRGQTRSGRRGVDAVEQVRCDRRPADVRGAGRVERGLDVGRDLGGGDLGNGRDRVARSGIPDLPARGSAPRGSTRPSSAAESTRNPRRRPLLRLQNAGNSPVP